MKKLEKGFTLIELMIVVAIIAILAAVAAPRFGTQIQKASDAKGIQLVGTWRSAYQMYYADELVYAQQLGLITKYVDDKAMAATYESNGAAKLDKATTATGAAIVVGMSTNVGTSDTANKRIAKFGITGAATNSSIEFDSSNGNDAKGTAWSTY